MTTSSEASRRIRILEAAEHAFAEFGFAGASLRHIVREAKVNLATVYYYFGSKNGLMDAVLKRRFGPLRQENLDRLRGLQRAANGRPLSVESILEALVVPPLKLAAIGSVRQQAVARLIGRIVTEPHPETQEFLRNHSAEIRSAFLEALQASLPRVPAMELAWRLEFIWGALAFILCNPRRLEGEGHAARRPADMEAVAGEMIRFFAPAFRAPAARRRKSPS